MAVATPAVGEWSSARATAGTPAIRPPTRGIMATRAAQADQEGERHAEDHHGDEDDQAEQEAHGEGAEHVGRHRTGHRRRDVQDRLAQPGVHVHQGTPAQDGRLQEHEQGEEGDGGEGDDGREDGLAQVGPDRQGRLAQVVGRLLTWGRSSGPSRAVRTAGGCGPASRDPAGPGRPWWEGVR